MEYRRYYSDTSTPPSYVDGKKYLAAFLPRNTMPMYVFADFHAHLTRTRASPLLASSIVRIKQFVGSVDSLLKFGIYIENDVISIQGSFDF